MAQEHLDCPDSDARCEPVGRQAVAPRMETLAVGDLSAPLRMSVDLLGRAAGPRRVGSASRQPPRGWPIELPGGPPCGPQAGGEPRVASLAPFALVDAEQPPIPVDSGEVQPDDCAAA
jgi:hypothetical protein